MILMFVAVGEGLLSGHLVPLSLENLSGALRLIRLHKNVVGIERGYHEDRYGSGCEWTQQRRQNSCHRERQRSFKFEGKPVQVRIGEHRERLSDCKLS